MTSEQERSALAELTEAAMIASLFGLFDQEQRATFGAEARSLGGGAIVRFAAAPDIPMLTRAVGVGVREPWTGELIDSATDFLAAAGGAHSCLQIAPPQLTPEVRQLLGDRGYQPGGSWAKMMRAAGETVDAPTDLRVEMLTSDQADEMARVQIAGFEMPDALVPWSARQVTTPNWHAWGAFDAGTMVACGLLFVHGQVGHLSGAATLPSHRGRGAQGALMKARIDFATDLGLAWITAETGTETPEQPNASLHNMYRAGLELLYDRQNWLRPNS